MFSVLNKYVFYTLLNILISIDGLVELPKLKVTDLLTTEEIIKNCTNSVLSSLKLDKPVNFTRIRDYATTLNYFLSITFRDTELLNEIARLTSFNKTNNKTEGNLTTIVNELLDEYSYDYKANDNGIDDFDASVVKYINSFLVKLKLLKENFGVNKVFADINSNIIKIFRSANESFLEKNQFEKSTKDTVDNFDIFDSGELWQESARRIFKGKRTKIKYFPFMASVQIFDTFQCAGSIIKSDIIITASSCLQLAWNNRLYRENPSFLSVRVGSSFYASGGENIPVLEIYFHPEYNPKTLRNNLSLMRLVRHIKFRHSNRKKVQKIAIDKQGSNMPINIPGITILGWGAKGANNRLGNPWDNILSYAILDVFPLTECQEIYTREYVTNKNFCGGFFSKGGGACNRDVGAPGVINGILMGVVSFGPPVCGTPEVPTVFTKLGYYYRWIQNIMDMEIPSGGKGTTLQMFVTSSTFEIVPTVPLLKPLRGLEQYEESMLKNVDGNLFQDFLRTMFGDDETQKYQYLLDQMKKKQLVEEIKKYHKETKEEDGYKGSEASEQTQISKPVVDEDEAIDVTYQPFTSVYETENYLYPGTFQDYKTNKNAPSTVLIYTDKNKVIEDDYSVTENTRGQQDSLYETEFIPITRHGKDIARNNIISSASTLTTNVEQSTLKTTKLVEQIDLDLAMESSEESDDSDQLRSDDKDDLSSIKDEVKTSHSKEKDDVPEEETLDKLLDEIDLNQIMKEVLTHTKQAQPERNQMKKKQSQRYVSLFLPASTPLVPLKRKVKGKVREKILQEKKEYHKNNGRLGHGFNESVLTLLYLSDIEKNNNLHVESRSFNDRSKNRIVQPSTLNDLLPIESIYKVIPKDNVYQIVSEVLSVAIENKNKLG